jgi:hypothetical protein
MTILFIHYPENNPEILRSQDFLGCFRIISFDGDYCMSKKPHGFFGKRGSLTDISSISY